MTITHTIYSDRLDMELRLESLYVPIDVYGTLVCKAEELGTLLHITYKVMSEYLSLSEYGLEFPVSDDDVDRISRIVTNTLQDHTILPNVVRDMVTLSLKPMEYEGGIKWTWSNLSKSKIVKLIHAGRLV